MESIPSMISYIGKVWQTFSSPLQKYPNYMDLLGFCIAHYTYPLELLREDSRVASSQYAFLSYSKLKKCLAEAVTGVSQKLELEDAFKSEEMRALLAEEEAKVATYHSSHHHSIGMCCGGMEESELRALLDIVYKTHSFK